ncbi:LuxR C-terminal-related transcriptional regulator [Streptomyces sp. NPDC086549]|uniref:helix-turn-helix transcriptional regulator n=1 Tax=Streptomyces sp. NPDC086549 TaxID=3365752 RepID=UPI00382A074C
MPGSLGLDDFVAELRATLDEAREATDQLAELSQAQRTLERRRATAMDLISRYAHAHVPPGTTHARMERLEGVAAVRERLNGITQDVREEVMTLCPGGAQTPEGMAASRPHDGVLLGRGVRMRAIFTESARRDSATMEYINWLGGQGGQVRTASEIPLRMIVLDRETAVVPLVPDRSEVGAVVLHGPGPIAALIALFEQIWAGGVPVDSSEAVGSGMDRQEREVLRLLAQGLTDEAVALRLGVSVRTTRRMVARLMERLGARSRFQAGVLAAQGDWF